MNPVKNNYYLSRNNRRFLPSKKKSGFKAL